MALSEAQRRILSNIATGRDTYSGFSSGREARGGTTGPVAWLVRKGLVRYGATVHDLLLTPAGRAALGEKDSE